MELRTSTNAMKITTACVRTVVLTTPTRVRARALLLWGSSPVQPRLLVAGNARSLRERSDRQTRRQTARSHPCPKTTLAHHELSLPRARPAAVLAHRHSGRRSICLRGMMVPVNTVLRGCLCRCNRRLISDVLHWEIFGPASPILAAIPTRHSTRSLH